MHSMFASTSCPGAWLTNKIVSGQFEKDIKAKMAGDKPKPVYTPIKKEKDQSVYRLYNKSTGDHLLTLDHKEAEAVHKAGWIYEGVAWIAPKEGDPVYRLYIDGRHIFTLNPEEKKNLVLHGAADEGVAFRSGGPIEIWRLYNPHTGDHILTASRSEHDGLSKAGWYCEGQKLRGIAVE